MRERIRVAPDDGGKPFTLYLRQVEETDRLLTGIETDREGEDVVPRGADERRHVVDKSLITRRTPLRYDNHTGLLVEKETDS